MFLLRRVTIERSMVENDVPNNFIINFFFTEKGLNPKHPPPHVCMCNREKSDSGFRCRPVHTVQLLAIEFVRHPVRLQVFKSRISYTDNNNNVIIKRAQRSSSKRNNGRGGGGGDGMCSYIRMVRVYGVVVIK